jgi:DNA-binding SARP family transcriptional activator/DNA-binding XRE family transcriptional regulator
MSFGQEGGRSVRGRDFGLRLMAWRNQNRVSQEGLAERAGISVRALRDIENGRVANPQGATISALEAVMGTAHTAVPSPCVQALGPLTITANGAPVRLRSVMQRCLLGLLVLHPHQPVARDQIVDVLWGERPPQSCLNLVHTYVTRLRKALHSSGDEVIALVTGGYLLRLRDEQVDMWNFEALKRAGAKHAAVSESDRAIEQYAQALECWRGPALMDLTDTLRLHPAAVAANQKRIEVALDFASLVLEAGHPARALSTLRSLVEHEPLHEGLHAQLMLILAADGQRAEALTVFEVVRQRLREELGADPGSDLAQAQLHILRSDALPRAPAHLPPQTTDFTGRDHQLHRILAALADRQRVVISALLGTPGIGKTTLAVHAAHQVRDRYPDGQLYVNLRGAGAHPMPPNEALGLLLEALGVDPAVMPNAEDARSALLRSKLADRRVLLLLDDACDTAQVLPLLPGTGGCAALVTSRSTLADLTQADRIELDILTPADAGVLFGAIVGRRRAHAEPAATQQVLQICAGLPLAIRIAAARIAARPTWSIQYLADKLTDERRRLTELAVGNLAVRASFEVSYAVLEDPRAFRLLGLFPGTELGISAAAALLGRTAEVTESALESLVDAHLLSTPRPGRYQFHDLLRAYAAERVRAEEPTREQDDAITRLLTWYLHTASTAGSALVPHRPRADLTPHDASHASHAFPTIESALAWYEEERTNLLALQQQAIGIGAHAIAWKLPVALWDFYYLRSHWTDWIASHQAGLICAQRDNDSEGEAGVLTSLAHAYLEAAEPRLALDTAQRALCIWRAIGHPWGEGMALHVAGGAHKALGQLPESIDTYQQAQRIHTAINNTWGSAWTLAALSTVHTQLADYRTALTIAQQAIGLWREIGDPYGEGFSLNDLADNHLALRHYDDAIICYRQAAHLNQQLGNQWSHAWALRGIGDTHHATNNPTQAREHWLAALSIYQHLGAPQARELNTRLNQRQPDAVPLD